MDKVSIVVAVYNAEKFLRKCVDSLLNQTYKNIEIILVNDCSKDNSLSICKEYESKYSSIVVVNNVENQGVSSTRNNGIEVSTGEYICFVDSDDYVEPDYISCLYATLKNYNLKLAICGCQYHNYIDNSTDFFLWNKTGKTEVVSLSKGFELSNALYLNALWNKLFITKLIKDNQLLFDVRLSMGEDAKFSLEYIKLNGIAEVVALSKPLYHYIRMSDSSLMSNYYKQASGDYSQNLRLLYEIVKPLNRDADRLYENAVASVKSNLRYNIIRSNNSISRKIQTIKNLYPEYNNKMLIGDYILLIKEKVAKLFHR